MGKIYFSQNLNNRKTMKKSLELFNSAQQDLLQFCENFEETLDLLKGTLKAYQEVRDELPEDFAEDSGLEDLFNQLADLEYHLLEEDEL